MITKFQLEPQQVHIKSETDFADGFYRVHVEGRVVLSLSPRGDVYVYLDGFPATFRVKVYKDGNLADYSNA